MSRFETIDSVELGDLTFESTVRAADVPEKGLRVYGVNRTDGLTPDAKYTSKELSRYKVLRPGMFAYNPMRLNIGSIALCTDKHAVGLVSPDYVVFGCKPHALDPSFLGYAIKGPEWRQWTTAAGVGSVRVRIYFRELAKMPIRVPPLHEQLAISAVLGALDEQIELNRRISATLEAMARALFHSWFVDFDPVHAKLDGRSPSALDANTAALFPASFQHREAGQIPKGWRVMKVGEFIERLPVGQKYEQKTVALVGKVPVLDQGKSGVIGFHNNEPGVSATLDTPVVVFANHTCYMRLITYSFSAIQNVLPFVGSGVDTFWAYYATEGRLSFSEYKGYWPDFVNQESVVPPRELTDTFGRFAKSLVAQIRNYEEQSRTLAALRDTLLPKLLSGEFDVSRMQKPGT